MRVTILGSGSSSGTPAVDLGWGACDPANLRNRRLRPSILVEQGTSRLLVDTSPDLRQQLLNVDINRLDAVLFTHGHADHLHGIDDLRPVNRAMKRSLDIYADRQTLDEIRSRFGYVFEPLVSGVDTFYKPVLVPHEIAPGQRLSIAGIPIAAFRQDHGFSDTLGFRFGPIAYSTDLTDIPDDSFKALEGIQVWIVGTLADTAHPTHAHVQKALAWARRIQPGRLILTHIGVRLDHERMQASLPPWAEPGYDGMVIEAD